MLLGVLHNKCEVRIGETWLMSLFDSAWTEPQIVIM